MNDLNPDKAWQSFSGSHSVGDVVSCRVSRIEPSGVYADIGGVEGVIHPSQIDGLSMVFKNRGLQVGQSIRAKIVGMTRNPQAANGRVSLSLTAMLDPSVNSGSTGEDFGGVAPASAESDGEDFGATEANQKRN